MTGCVPHFSNPDAVSDYAQNVRRMVPGLDDLHRMMLLLLAKNAPLMRGFWFWARVGGWSCGFSRKANPAGNLTALTPHGQC